MKRMPFAVAILIAAIEPGTGRADILPNFANEPNTYVPGTSFSFEVTIPDYLNGVSTFTVSLILDAAVNNPDVTLSAAAPASGYIFPSSSTFSSTSTTGPGANEVFLQFSDSNTQTTSTPSNDILGIVTVSTGSDLTGAIDISFATGTIVTPAGNFSGTSVQYFSEGFGDSPGQSIEIDQGVAPVPAPAGLVTLASGFALLYLRSRLKSGRSRLAA